MINRPLVYIKSLDKLLNVERINYDIETVEVCLDKEGDFFEYDFKDIIFLDKTPLKDSDNVELYEYDVLHINNNCIEDIVILTKDSIGIFFVEGVKVCGEFSRLLDFKVKRVGNYYENTDILKKEKKVH